MWGVRLLSLQTRRPLEGDDNTLALDTYEVPLSAHLLTNIEGIHALTAWRRYNRGAVVEQRIKELGQLGAGATAIDDLNGNALLWATGAIAYQAPAYAQDHGPLRSLAHGSTQSPPALAPPLARQAHPAQPQALRPVAP